jgi:predicted negative regulator of RcsB-dependent stress response
MPRIHWSIRYLAFALSTFTLSLFFAGWREVNTTMHWSGFLLLAAGVVLTLLLLMLQGYWIYFEEKNKGSLKKTSKLFESIYQMVERKYAHNKLVRLLQPQLIVNQQEVPNHK